MSKLCTGVNTFLKVGGLLITYSGCQKKVPFAEGFFATTAYAAILLIGAYL